MQLVRRAENERCRPRAAIGATVCLFAATFKTSGAPLTALCCLACLTGIPAARAQHVLVVLEDGRPEVVRDVRYGHPQIEVDGKRRSADGTQFALRDAAIYGSGFIDVTNFQVQSYHEGIEGDSSQLNAQLKIRGALESEGDLEQCFAVLSFKVEREEGVVFAELPNLVAGKRRQIDLRFPLSRPLGKGELDVHFFSRGFEILHSRMPAGYVERQKQRTTEFLNRPSDRPVKLASAVKPHYPDGLPDGEGVGSAKVRCRIDTDGRVAEATVVECTHPAFGEAALEAVREWIFEPAIKDHKLVEATVEIPFAFKPPVAAEARDPTAPEAD